MPTSPRMPRQRRGIKPPSAREVSTRSVDGGRGGIGFSLPQSASPTAPSQRGPINHTSTPLLAAAFALKCKAVRFYIWCVGAGFYPARRFCIMFRAGQSPAPTHVLPSVRPVFPCHSEGAKRPWESVSLFPGGPWPPPTFAAARQRRDLIIAKPLGGCFQRGRARTGRKLSERKIV